MATTYSRGQVESVDIKEFTSEEIQKAKDFIWEHLPNHTKEIIILEATTPVLSKNNLEIDFITLRTLYK